MPIRVWTAKDGKDKEFERLAAKAHMTLEKGERIWTSHIFESRDDRDPKNTDKNFVCKILAKEKLTGRLQSVMIWEYPTKGYWRKYEARDIDKESYDKMIGLTAKSFEDIKRMHHEVIYPHILDALKSKEDGEPENPAYG